MSNSSLFIHDLKLSIRGEVLSDAGSLGMYATDASLYQLMPVVVVLPKDEADVLKAIQIAADHKVSILPRGAGTSLAGQAVGHSMVLDFSKYMDGILEINVGERWARVQPGVVRDVLNEGLKPDGLHFAPDPATSSRANIGGMIANNSSGTKSILYGKTVDHLLEVKVALSNGNVLIFKELAPEEYSKKATQSDREGEIYRGFKNIIQKNESEIIVRFPKVMRRVQGYNLDEFAEKENWNLAKVICGSEGTLGVILEAKIRLEPLPKNKSVCVAHFAGFLESVRAVEPILEFQPSAVEILDKYVIELSRNNLETNRLCDFIEGSPAAVLVIEFFGETADEAREKPAQMIEKLKKSGMGYAFPVFAEVADMNRVWAVRKKGLGLLMAMKGDRKPLAFIEDAAIPVKHLPEYIEAVLKICEKHHTRAAAYAHASVGVIHVRPILDLRKEKDIERFKNISRATFELVKKYGGSWSGEHGDGLVRSAYLKEFFDEPIFEAFRKVKQLFDPQGLMNPGKIIDAPPIDQNLRYGPAYRDHISDTVFKYGEDGSFAHAVHMCTGVGECRKTIGGTMCPSFKATRDEEHSTRGRANILRLAMSGQLSANGLLDGRVKEALHLCLSCKACKSECPSNVDMAKLKGEIWQKHYDKKGIPIRDRLIRDSAKMAKWFSGFPAPFINRIQKRPFFRWLLEKMAGIDRRRILPEYARKPFSPFLPPNPLRDASAFVGGKKGLSGQLDQPPNVRRTWPSHPFRGLGGRIGQVFLFTDTYLNYHEPQIGRAAKNLLESLGYEVLLADVGCCQRPRISHGFLKMAKKEGTQTVRKLDQYLKKGIPVLVCEPGCASALYDDLPDLIDDEELAKRLKNGVKMIDVFLAEELEAGRLEWNLKPLKSRIYVHGHCHQKSLYGTKAMKVILEKSGAEVVEIPSGCCGMAGSFGYEKEHYELSRKVGEEILFPAVRALKKGDVLIADGISCRHQIEHFTGRGSVHWVEVFNSFLDG